MNERLRLRGHWTLAGRAAILLVMAGLAAWPGCGAEGPSDFPAGLSADSADARDSFASSTAIGLNSDYFVAIETDSGSAGAPARTPETPAVNRPASNSPAAVVARKIVYRATIVLDVAHKTIEVTGSRSVVRHVEPMTDDPRRRRPDIGLARQVLGWQPLVGLEEGLRSFARQFAG